MQDRADGAGPAMQPSIAAWLRHFAQAVRANDLEAGTSLFDEHAVGYGTRERRATGRDHLVEQQWRPTWRRITSWTVDEIDVAEWGDGLAVVAFTWKRETDDAAAVNGRATLVLKDVGTGWRCIHSHFSANPQVTPEGYW
jgi:ketosteroid isomerase-like protein